MNRQRKSYREVQLEKQIEQLISENSRLKDCILLQQKIIEKQKKQKQSIHQQFTTSLQEKTSCYHKMGRYRVNSELEERQNKLIKCMSSKIIYEYDAIETLKLQKLCSTNNDSRKTFDDQIDQSLKNGKSKKKLLSVQDLKQLNVSISSTNLYKPTLITPTARRKSYLQKLAQQITND